MLFKFNPDHLFIKYAIKWKQPLQRCNIWKQKKLFSTKTDAHTHTPSGKKNTNILDQYNIMEQNKSSKKITIEEYSSNGFKINNVNYEGSVIVFPTRVLQWNVTSWNDVTLESLAPVQLLLPRSRVVVLGCGTRMQFPSREILQFMYKKGISLEPMDTARACSTFNFANQEEREVVACLLAFK